MFRKFSLMEERERQIENINNESRTARDVVQASNINMLKQRREQRRAQLEDERIERRTRRDINRQYQKEQMQKEVDRRLNQEGEKIAHMNDVVMKDGQKITKRGKFWNQQHQQFPNQFSQVPLGD